MTIETTVNEEPIESLASMNECMLSTVDNPFDPFEQFDDWFRFDVEKGYYSCNRLARIANVSDDFTEKELNNETERAIDEIIKYDFLGIYTKVRKTENKKASIA